MVSAPNSTPSAPHQAEQESILGHFLEIWSWEWLI